MKHTKFLRTRAASAILGSAILWLAAVPPAAATIMFYTGNQQYTNVNIAADTDALSVVGDIGNTGITMTFENMIGPDGVTQVSMHGQHGVAFIESYHDSTTNNHTGFTSIDLVPQSGYGFTAGDFALDQLNGTASPATVTLLGIDQFGNPFSQNESLSVNGQNQYNFVATAGELVTLLRFSTSTASPFADLKQVSLAVASVPEPSPLSLFLTGILVIAGPAAWRYLKARRFPYTRNAA